MKKLLLFLLLSIAAWGQTITDMTLETTQTATAQKTFSLGATHGPVTFANLTVTPSQVDGTFVYVSDGTVGNPCTGSGTGAFAVHANGAWNCFSGTTTITAQTIPYSFGYNTQGLTILQSGCQGLTASADGTNAAVVANATDPAGIALTTSASASLGSGSTSGTGRAYIAFTAAGTGSFQTTRGTLKSARWRVALGSTTSIRVFIGFYDTYATNAQNFDADVPVAGFIGFRYSTNSSDAKWQLITQTSSGASTIVAESTASHVDTSPHNFDITNDGTNINFFIDGTAVGSQSTNLPATTLLLGPAVFLNNARVAVARTTTTYFHREVLGTF